MNRWTPKKGKHYFYCEFYDKNGVQNFPWYGSSVDKNLYNHYNCFEKEEQSKEAFRRIKEVLKKYQEEINK